MQKVYFFYPYYIYLKLIHAGVGGKKTNICMHGTRLIEIRKHMMSAKFTGFEIKINKIVNPQEYSTQCGFCNSLPPFYRWSSHG